MSGEENALKVTRALLIALQAYEQIGGDSMRLLLLRNHATAEGREISPEEITGILAQSQAAINDLNNSLGG